MGAVATTGDELDEQDVITPARVIPPELRFTTDDDELDEVDEEPIMFEVDGAEYTINRPRKLEEVLAQLIEAGARRATTADALYAASKFLDRVMAPESLQRLQARLDNDNDKFRLRHLFDILERVVKELDVASSRSSAPANGPARARRARRG